MVSKDKNDALAKMESKIDDFVSQFFNSNTLLWDVHGSEDSFFIEKLGEHVRTVFTSQCSNPSCPVPTSILTTREFCAFS